MGSVCGAHTNEKILQDVERKPLGTAYAALLANGLDDAGEALRILVKEVSRIETEHFLNARPYERMGWCTVS